MSGKEPPEMRDSPLWEAAVLLRRRAAGRKSRDRDLPPLLFVTDPDRTPDPAPTIRRLPSGAGVIYRGFGRPDAAETARALAGIAAERGLVLLIGLDEALAESVGAHGVHLPERALDRAADIRRRRPGWLITGAAHGQAALETAARAGVDAVLLSPVFASDSPSAGEPLGVQLFTGLVRSAFVPVYALGGVTAATAPQLVESGACGLAAVGGLLEL
jgi:thiamine-phosphate pyrophosphorylase